MKNKAVVDQMTLKLRRAYKAVEKKEMRSARRNAKNMLRIFIRQGGTGNVGGAFGS